MVSKKFLVANILSLFLIWVRCGSDSVPHRSDRDWIQPRAKYFSFCAVVFLLSKVVNIIKSCQILQRAKLAFMAYGHLRREFHINRMFACHITEALTS